MCGIGAIHFLASRPLSSAIKLMELTEGRGQDSFGLAVVKPNKLISEFRSLRPISSVKQEVFDFLAKSSEVGDFLLWCCRAQPITERQNVTQPVIVGELVGVHNGVVANDKELEQQFSIKNESGVDSEIPLHLVKRLGSIAEAMKLCSGGYAYIFSDSRGLTMFRDFKTLACGFSYGNFYCVSEEVWLTEVLREVVPVKFPPYTILYYPEMRLEPLETLKLSYLPESNPNKVVVCASGGIDSTTAAYALKKIKRVEVALCHFDYGQKATLPEWKAVQAIAEHLGASSFQIALGWLGQLGASALTSQSISHPGSIRPATKGTLMWVPSRNLVMASCLLAVAEARGYGLVSAGWNLEEEGVYPDNSIEFLNAMNQASTYGTLARPRLVMPLQRLMKPEEIILGVYLGVPYELTWSCDLGGELHCGWCSACYLHHNAFRLAGVADPTEYASTPEFATEIPWSNPICRSVEQMLSRIEL